MVLRLLFIHTHAPYQDFRAQETLDAILTASAFDQDITVLYMADGVYQLLARQDSVLLGQKPPDAATRGLHFYDINSVYAAETSLQMRGLSADDIVGSFGDTRVQTLTDTEIQTLFHQQDKIFSL